MDFPDRCNASSPREPRARPVPSGPRTPEGWLIRKDGTRFWAEVTLTSIKDAEGAEGNFRGYAKVAHDLTERKKYEEELRKSQEHFRLLVEAVEEYAILMLDADGRVASWNPGAQRILGYTSDEIVGKSVLRLYPAEDIRTGYPEEELQKARTQGVALDERWLVRKDGNRFWASGVTRALKQGGGRIRGFIMIFRDLTDRKRHEEEIERLNATLESRVAERTVQLEAFTYTVSHDLRAPVRAMGSFAEILLRDFGDRLGEEGRDCARRIEAAAGKMDSLIQDLLEYSQITAADLVL